MGGMGITRVSRRRSEPGKGRLDGEMDGWKWRGVERECFSGST